MVAHRRPAAGRPLRLLQITDFHFREQAGATLLGVDTEQSFLKTLASALAERPTPDLALLTGDLVQDPCPAAYRRLQACLGVLPCPAYCLPGNHDDPGLMASLLRPPCHLTERIDCGGWQILCLDSTMAGSATGRLEPGRLDSLERLLRDTAGLFTLVALHHPPVATGSAWLDTMQLENSESFLATLRGHDHVRAVIFGHIHQELDVGIQGLRLLGCPSTCFQFLPGQPEFALDTRPPGYRWIDLHPDGSITTEVRRIAWTPAGLSADAGGY